MLNMRAATLAMAILAFAACGAKKLETPEAALAAAQEAYLKRDPKAFIAVLSKETLSELEEKIESMRTMFQAMPENPQAAKAFEHMAKQMNMPVSKLKELTIEDFIGYMMQNEAASGSETTLLPKEMLPPAKVVRRTEKGNKATLYFEEDEKLSFIKTDAGWRVHLDAENVTAKGMPMQNSEEREE
ncbi:MAG: hypothetical protein ACOY5B_09695 [Spirochaetota bacterium]